MNKETLESIKRTAENHRSAVVADNYDIKSIITLLLSFVIETINYELEKTKSSVQLYK